MTFHLVDPITIIIKFSGAQVGKIDKKDYGYTINLLWPVQSTWAHDKRAEMFEALRCKAGEVSQDLIQSLEGEGVEIINEIKRGK